MAYVPPERLLEFPESVGVAIPGGQFRLEKDEGRPDAGGELVYSGPNVMMGYATSSADLIRPEELDELYTGDLAVQNSAGLYQIVGRRSRFIKPFGLRISLDEVERKLADQGIIAAAVGDDHLLAIYCENNIASNVILGLAEWLKIPAAGLAFYLLNSVPRSASGKIDYASLKRLFESAPENCQIIRQLSTSRLCSRLTSQARRLLINKASIVWGETR